MNSPGVFTISLDTELAWGSFDKGGVERHGDAYRATPSIVESLCALFDEYEVRATWALVAHLFSECDGHNNVSSDLAHEDWLGRAPCSTGVDRSLWYAPELLETIRACDTVQDVGLHAYSHIVFGEHSRSAADAELADAVAAANDAGLDPSSFVFPRNDIAFVDLLADHGLEVYRGVDARWYERAPVGPGRKPLRFFDEALARTPPSVTPQERDGLVEVPGSQVFRPTHGIWGQTPAGTQVKRAQRGIDRAVDRGEIFHLWFHPFNLAGDVEQHIDMLADILTYVDELRSNDDIECMSLDDISTACRDGRWIAPTEDLA